MDGRNRLHSLGRGGASSGRPQSQMSLHPRGGVHPAIMEERIAAQHREIQSLLVDNQRLGATHVALKQELAASQQELRHLSSTAAKFKSERDAKVSEVYERSLGLEAEVRSFDSVGEELSQARAQTEKLNAARMELASDLQAINGDLARARAELHQSGSVKAEVEALRLDIQRGRAAIENEKKTHAENLEHEQAMEKNMIVVSRELEKLRAELANAEKRARAAAAAAAAANPGPGYAGNYGNPEISYGGNPYAETYGMHQVPTGAEAGFQYGSSAAHVHR